MRIIALGALFGDCWASPAGVRRRLERRARRKRYDAPKIRRKNYDAPKRPNYNGKKPSYDPKRPNYNDRLPECRRLRRLLLECPECGGMRRRLPARCNITAIAPVLIPSLEDIHKDSVAPEDWEQRLNRLAQAVESFGESIAQAGTKLSRDASAYKNAPDFKKYYPVKKDWGIQNVRRKPEADFNRPRNPVGFDRPRDPVPGHDKIFLRPISDFVLHQRAERLVDADDLRHVIRKQASADRILAKTFPLASMTTFEALAELDSHEAAADSDLHI